MHPVFLTQVTCIRQQHSPERASNILLDMDTFSLIDGTMQGVVVMGPI